MRLNRKLISFMLAMLAALLPACTTSKQVPREEFEAASKQTLSMYIVTTSDNQVYRVKAYTVIDSMFIIDRLTSKDARYETAKMPIAIPLADVASVELRDSHRGAFLFIVPVVLITLFFYSVSQINIS